MSLNTIVKKIAKRKEIESKPPVLIDIGASGELNSVWKRIAPFSICIAFDADKREFDYIEKTDSVFKKQYVVNKIVVASADKKQAPFYLTKSPFCSSLLKPDLESLKDFQFSDLFEIQETVEIDVIELKDVLSQLNLTYIDWFKTDSQGTDLRLFKSLVKELQDRVLVLELEPGLIDAYKNEDKAIDVMNYMEKQPFFITDYTVKGALRIPAQSFNEVFKNDFLKKMATHTHKIMPSWVEMGYMNKLDDPNFTSREFLLSWLYATLKEHHDIAY
ncbi:MAG TPA: hypothetical protein PLL00_16235, partial [Bacteroidia bacterium]|nr:hypothetical protein [Bacteroidia bacterium]